MRITREMVNTQIEILQNDVNRHKQEKRKHTQSKAGLLDFSIFVLANLQLVSPDLEIDHKDPLFQKIAFLQKEIRELKR